MDGAAVFVLMLSVMAVFWLDVESEQRVCYSGPPPEPDPDHPEDWMKQVMQEIRKNCPGRRELVSVASKKPTPNATCAQPLGMEDGTISDDRISASSSWPDNDASEARLNGAKAWMARGADANPWIQIDMGESTEVSGVITQGNYGGWVKHFRVLYKTQTTSESKNVTDGNGNIKVFIGNTDDRSPVTNLFDESVKAMVVRIEPTEWQVGVALRLELLGCLRK